MLLMSLAVWRSGARERRVIREQLADEVGRAVSPDEYQDILRDGMFRLAASVLTDRTFLRHW